MSATRKHTAFNERVNLANERKCWIEESRRNERMAHDADVAHAQKRKRSKQMLSTSASV